MRIQTRRRIVYVHTVGVFPKANRNQPMSYSAFVLERSCQRRLPHCKCKYAFSNLNPPDRPSTIDVSRVTHLLWRDRYTTQELTAQIRHVSQSRSRASSLHMRQRVPRPASSAHAMHLRLLAAFIRGGASPTDRQVTPPPPPPPPICRRRRLSASAAAAATPPPADGFCVSCLKLIRTGLIDLAACYT
jgi:hypothetical protein